MTAIITLQSLRASFDSVGAETTELLLSAGVEIEEGAKGRIKYTGRINGHSATQCGAFLSGVYACSTALGSTSVSGWQVATIRQNGKPIPLIAILQSKGFADSNVQID